MHKAAFSSDQACSWFFAAVVHFVGQSTASCLCINKQQAVSGGVEHLAHGECADVMMCFVSLRVGQWNLPFRVLDSFTASMTQVWIPKACLHVLQAAEQGQGCSGGHGQGPADAGRDAPHRKLAQCGGRGTKAQQRGRRPLDVLHPPAAPPQAPQCQEGASHSEEGVPSCYCHLWACLLTVWRLT